MSQTHIGTIPTKVPEEGFSQTSPDRPIYDCPACGQKSMQFFHVLSETSKSAERTNSFVCFSCGRSWEM
jgi:DNA-directed RNA polymerase subunit M/transcription elongation factor TFIIS